MVRSDFLRVVVDLIVVAVVAVVAEVAVSVVVIVVIASMVRAFDVGGLGDYPRRGAKKSSSSYLCARDRNSLPHLPRWSLHQEFPLYQIFNHYPLSVIDF